MAYVLVDKKEEEKKSDGLPTTDSPIVENKELDSKIDKLKVIKISENKDKNLSEETKLILNAISDLKKDQDKISERVSTIEDKLKKVTNDTPHEIQEVKELTRKILEETKRTPKNEELLQKLKDGFYIKNELQSEETSLANTYFKKRCFAYFYSQGYDVIEIKLKGYGHKSGQAPTLIFFYNSEIDNNNLKKLLFIKKKRSIETKKGFDFRDYSKVQKDFILRMFLTEEPFKTYFVVRNKKQCEVAVVGKIYKNPYSL